jgi:hypothetical protein
LLKLLNDLNNQNPVDWSNWKNNEIKQICRFFVEKKYCKEYKDTLHQYSFFYEVVSRFDKDKYNLLTNIIIKSPGLKNYLQIHSVFDIGAKKEGDWLNKTMIRILDVTDSDIEIVHKKEIIPQEIIKKLEIFDPEPIGLETDNIRIEYDFWGFGGPIRIVDTDWESLDKKEVQVETFLSQYEPINTTVETPSSYTSQELELIDECPF